MPPTIVLTVGSRSIAFLRRKIGDGWAGLVSLFGVFHWFGMISGFFLRWSICWFGRFGIQKQPIVQSICSNTAYKYYAEYI